MPRLPLALALVLQEGHQVPQLDGFPIGQTLLASPAKELVEQSGVSSLGVLGLAALVTKVLEKIFNQVLHRYEARSG